MVDLKAKAEEIYLVISEPDVDLWKLRELALTEGGLVNDAIRKQAWPKLVGLHGIYEDEDLKRLRRIRPLPWNGALVANNSSHELQIPLSDSDESSQVSVDSNFNHRKKLVEGCVDADQIDRDVARCTWHLLSGSQRSRRQVFEKKHRKRVSSILRRKQRRLSNLIKLTLLRGTGKDSREEERLRYYQGFHDVASIFLAVLGGSGSGPRGRMPATAPDSTPIESIALSLGLDLPSRALCQLSRSHFRDALKSSFMQLQAVLRLVLFPLIAAFDPEVHSYLLFCDMEPFFAISWVITWFSHDVRDTELVKRLFDAFIVSHPLFSLYLSVAMVLHPINRKQILTTECDFACIHQTLLSLPSNSCMDNWNCRWGDVFSDDDDEGTASTDLEGSHASDDYVVVEGNDDESTETDCFFTVGPISPSALVPFQELIDNALFLMRRIPPRKLLGLAKRYYAEESLRPLLLELPSINLFQSPPAWALASKAKADWVLKQRERERLGLPSRSRKIRRKRPVQLQEVERPLSGNELRETADEVKKYLKENCRNLAVIASGFGPGDENRNRNRRKVAFAIAVAVLAVSCALFMRYRSRPVSTPPICGNSEIGFKTDTVGMVSAGQCDLSNKETTSVGTATTTPETKSVVVELPSRSVIVELKLDRRQLGLPVNDIGGWQKNEINEKTLPSEFPRGLEFRSESAETCTVLVKAGPYRTPHSDTWEKGLLPYIRETLFSFHWINIRDRSLLLAQSIHRVLEQNINKFIQTATANIRSLEWSGLKENSVASAHAFRRAVGIKYNELIQLSKSALVDKLDLKDNKRLGDMWFGVTEGSRHAVSAVVKIAKGIVKNVGRIISEDI